MYRKCPDEEGEACPGDTGFTFLMLFPFSVLWRASPVRMYLYSSAIKPLVSEVMDKLNSDSLMRPFQQVVLLFFNSIIQKAEGKYF